MENPILTVYCLAYNHGEYIRKTLDGFVNQKTEYSYKVIVHDDASKDDTAQIIKEYAEKYPAIIFPIFQTENQYSKGISILKEYVFPLVQSKYIAICEGDDYWCDENKLQIQLDYMENNPDCVLCVHNTELINEDGSSKGVFFNKSQQDKDLTTEEIIEAGGGGLFHTSSFLYRYEYRKSYPNAFIIKGVGDYPLGIYLSTKGRVRYIAKVMSKYRVMSKGSWTSKIVHNKKTNVAHLEKMMAGIDAMDRELEFKYCKPFKFAKKRYKFNKMNKYKKIICSIFSSDYRKLLKTHLKNKKGN